MLDTRYLRFCLPGSDFYDLPAPGVEHEFALVSEDLPAGWKRFPDTPWVGLQPIGVDLPTQGWKVHVSTTPGAAADRLAVTWSYCREHRIAFKFLRSCERLLEANSKYCHRGSSGKFITIYPVDEIQCEAVLRDLDAMYGGDPGPYILSDRRWRTGPLFVRYGGFTPRFCRDEKGDAVPAIESPDGTLVPDRREAAFKPPSWVSLPDWLQADAQTSTGAAFPYRATSALHFSNAGGVYIADDKRTDQRVVLKEARPYTGLDPNGGDAMIRLRREAEILRKLSGTGVTPDFHDSFTAWEHQFVAMEHVDGLDLKRASMDRLPLLRPGSTDEDTREYVTWALMVLDRIEAAMAAIHERGVVIGDIHPKNILLHDDHPVFIDFEFGGMDDPDHRSPLAAPGFAPPLHLRGTAADRWGLAALRLDMFYPLTNVVDLEPGKLRQMAKAAGRRYHLPHPYVTQMIRDLLGSPDATGFRRPVSPVTGQFLEGEQAPPWSEVCTSMARAILASATPDREDRLFPADIEAFNHGQGLGFAYGAAGVLHTLHATGHGRHPEHEEWLVKRAHAVSDPTPGFYSGLHGVAYTLLELGREQDAIDVLRRARAIPLTDQGIDYFHGLSGMALNLLHFAHATGDTALTDEAVGVAQRLARQLTATPPVTTPDPQHGQPGVLRGWSGPALLFIRLYEQSGDDHYLDLAADALRRDLADCTITKNNTLEADQGWRTLPYLEIGSVGVGMVLCEYLRHRQDPDMVTAQAGIDRSASYEYYVQPTLHFGRAGVMLYLSRRRAATAAQNSATSSEFDTRITSVMDTLHDHTIPYQRHIAFPGNQGLRLAMDVATGTAGVLLAVHSALHGGPGLPFLSPEGASLSGRMLPGNKAEENSKELHHAGDS